MKKSFAEKSNSLVFLGAAFLISTVALFLHSCNKKSGNDEQEKIPVKKTPKQTVSKNAKEPFEIPDDPNKRYIYLTFDDGPNQGTKNLIKLVHKHQIPITSFVIGKHVYGSKTQRKEFEELEKDSLTELANHSFSHAENRYSHFYKDPETVVTDFNRAKDSLKFDNNYARTPGRNIWRTAYINSTDIKASKNSADELQKANYTVIGWDLEWKPDNSMKLKGSHKDMIKRVDSIFFNDLEKTPRHLVFLTHDQYLQDENSVQEMDLFITGLQNSNRFEFRKISKYPKIDELLK